MAAPSEVLLTFLGVEEAFAYTKDLCQDIAVYSREETSQGPQLRKAKL